MTVPDRAGQTWRIDGTTFVILSTVVDTRFKGSWHDTLCLDDEDNITLLGTAMRFFEGEIGLWDDRDYEETWVRIA